MKTFRKTACRNLKVQRQTERLIAMKKYKCEVCGYIYDPVEGDPDNGVQPGTAFADIPEDWVCPLCGVGKDQFVETDE